jgi:hypothetical protein
LEVYTDPDTGEAWNVIALDFAEYLARGHPMVRLTLSAASRWW